MIPTALQPSSTRAISRYDIPTRFVNRVSVILPTSYGLLFTRWHGTTFDLRMHGSVFAKSK